MSGGPIGGGLAVTVELNEGILISGRASYHGAVPDARRLARAARRQAYEGQLQLKTAPHAAESVLRHALEMLVDAFLLNRRANAPLFADAHRLGALLQERFGCRWRTTENGKNLENPCGVLALHARVGLSPGGRTWGHCSICGADDFQCDHIPGCFYEGVHCFREIYRWDGEEISFTPRPRDPRSFRVWVLVPKAEVPQATPVCEHCRYCVGKAGASASDMDPGLWSADPEELIAATISHSRAALASG